MCINEANQKPDRNIISLTDDIKLTDGDMAHIKTPITIEGNWYSISGDHRFRVFYVEGGIAHLTLNGVIIYEGNAGNESAAVFMSMAAK
jgi:hypothetical protein